MYMLTQRLHINRQKCLPFRNPALGRRCYIKEVFLKIKLLFDSSCFNCKIFICSRQHTAQCTLTTAPAPANEPASAPVHLGDQESSAIKRVGVSCMQDFCINPPSTPKKNVEEKKWQINFIFEWMFFSPKIRNLGQSLFWIFLQKLCKNSIVQIHLFLTLSKLQQNESKLCLVEQIFIFRDQALNIKLKCEVISLGPRHLLIISV